MKRCRTTFEQKRRPTKNMHGLPCPYSSLSPLQSQAAGRISCTAADAFGTDLIPADTDPVLQRPQGTREAEGSTAAPPRPGSSTSSERQMMVGAKT